MCTVLLAYKMSPGYPLIVAANRDEFVPRPTAHLDYWDDGTTLAGRDLEAGGTWLGLSTTGKFGVITNFRESIGGGNYLSRGNIIKDYLQGSTESIQSAEQLMREPGNYLGFNVVLGDVARLCYCSNRENDIQLLGPGVYGLSNHLLDTPWPKVLRGKEHFSQLVNGGVIDHDRYFAMLTDEYRPSIDLLPDTGVGLDWEILLSSMFITSPGYGTRSSAVITISTEGEHRFSERSYNHDNRGWFQTDEQVFQFYHI